MKIKHICSLVLCLSLLMGCSSTNQHNTQLPNVDHSTAAVELKMPETMKELADNPNVQWMAGMLVVLDDSDKICGISQESFEVFTDPGDVIKATITAQNGLGLSQRFDLMVFADGVPMEFTVDGVSYRSYPMALAPQKTSVNIEFNKEFVLNLGRLDFVLSFAENPQADSHLVFYTVWIELDTEPLYPSSLCSTVEQRVGVQGTHIGGSYNSWFWERGIVPTETDFVGSRTISVQDGEMILLEAIASDPGRYRTVLVVEGTPIEFEMDGNQYSYLDWESTGTNMLQLPITLTDVPSTGSIYTITTPLDKDDLAQLIVASSKVELVEYKEE